MGSEIDLLPVSISVDIWPIFINHTQVKDGNKRPNITTHIYNSPTINDKIKCLLNAFYVFFKEGEIKGLISKKGFFRNVAKAIKFAYISEIRLLSIRKWLISEENTLDFPIFYSYWMYEAAYICARLKTLYPKCTFVTRCHGYDLYEERHPNGYLPFRNFILRKADLICPISDNGKEYLLKQYGSKIKNKIQIARLGTIRKAEIPAIQENENAVVLVSCSNLVDVKRVDLIISALRKTRKSIVWYHFGDGELRSSLERQASSLPKNIRYKFMGYKANEDVQKFYAEHYIDAFVNVSKSEGVPVSVMEAESYGIPVIATDVGGTSEIVHNGKNGILLTADFTDEELLDAINTVVDNAKQYRVEAFRTWKNMSDAQTIFPEFYKKLMEVR